MIRLYKMVLDSKNEHSALVIKGRLGDKLGAVRVDIAVLDQGKVFDFTGLTPKFEAKLADGSNIVKDSRNFSNVKSKEGKFSYLFPDALFSVPGTTLSAYFTFVDAKNNKQSTFDIVIKIVGMALDGRLATSYVSEVDGQITDIKNTMEETVMQAIDTHQLVEKSKKELSMLSSKTTKLIINTSNVAVATVNTKGNAVLKSFAENGQFPKITEDDGSSITVSGYDLLNIEDIKNFDGYVTSAKNTPTTSNAGYVKRKYRSGYIEISYAPHSQKAVYRNAYNSAAKKWVGWTKGITTADDYQTPTITKNDGRAKVYLTGDKVDVYAELLKLDRGLYSIYINANTINSASSTLRGTVFVEGKAQWLSVLGSTSNNNIYSLHYNNGKFSGWNKSRVDTPKKIVFDGAVYAIGSQIYKWNGADLKQSLVLEFSRYKRGEGALDYGHMIYTIPLESIVKRNGSSFYFPMSSGASSKNERKILYVSTTEIKGHNDNSLTGNDSWALRRVLVC